MMAVFVSNLKFPAPILPDLLPDCSRDGHRLGSLGNKSPSLRGPRRDVNLPWDQLPACHCFVKNPGFSAIDARQESPPT
jgi:hypothetical protein